MELYQLQYFQMLCQTKNYRKAAERLMISQPAVSIAIKKLEDELGGALIDRTKKTFALTPMGEALYKRALLINTEILDVYREMDIFSNVQRTDIVRVAVPDIILPELFKEITLSFVPNFPEIPVSLSKKDQQSIIKGLEDREIDIGVICADAIQYNPKFNTRTFGKVELYATFSSQSRFFGMEKIPREMLSNEPLLIAKSGIISNVIINYVREASIEPICFESFEIDLHTSDAFKLSSEGVGIAFLDKKIRKRGNCAPLDPPLMIDVVIAWSNNVTSEKKLSMIKQVADYIESLGDQQVLDGGE